MSKVLLSPGQSAVRSQFKSPQPSCMPSYTQRLIMAVLLQD